MCQVCENIYFSERNKEYCIDINTYNWNERYDEYDYITIPINFCYECGKDYRRKD
jgi:hypothetical protein